MECGLEASCRWEITRDFMEMGSFLRARQEVAPVRQWKITRTMIPVLGIRAWIAEVKGRIQTGRLVGHDEGIAPHGFSIAVMKGLPECRIYAIGSDHPRASQRGLIRHFRVVCIVRVKGASDE